MNNLLAKRNKTTGENTFNGYHFDLEGNYGSSKGKKNFVLDIFADLLAVL